MERRKKTAQLVKSSPLPVDYLKMVTEIFTTNFDAGLQALNQLKRGEASFRADGQVYPDEVVLKVSLMQEGQIAATTAYASCDFDPKASSPTVQDLLGACVDAVGSLFGTLLDPENPAQLEQLADESLSALENVPFEWNAVDIERRKVYLKIDKSNPQLDRMADDWLAKHDPDFQRRQQEEDEETEKLFVTGPRGPGKKPGSGQLH